MTKKFVKKWRMVLIGFLLVSLTVLTFVASGLFAFLHLTSRTIFILHNIGTLLIILTSVIVIFPLLGDKEEKNS